MSLKEPLCTKVAPNDFLGLLRCQTNIFTPKVDQILMPPKKFARVKTYHFWEMTSGYPTLWIGCRKKMKLPKHANVAVFRLFLDFKYLCPIYVRKVANMSTFSISAQYVRMSLKEPLVYKSSRKWLCWVYFDTNKHFSPKSRLNYSGLQRNFLGGQKLLFLRMTQAYNTWCVWYRKS